MNFIRFLKAARAKTLDENPAVEHFSNRLYSGCTYAIWREANRLTREHAAGRVLDAGCGRGGWKALIESTGAKRESLDIKAYDHSVIDWVADITNMPQVPTDRFDCVICHQVLEHVTEPEAALRELHRVLKPGGKLVLNVPHLSRLHELPHDYYRYTPMGISHLLEKTELEPILIDTYGGLFTFLHHQFSMIFLGISAVFRPLYFVAIWLNAPFSILAYFLDALIDRAHLFPNGVVAVARKRPK
jgi:SAM-dependent methyltransferase